MIASRSRLQFIRIARRTLRILSLLHLLSLSFGPTCFKHASERNLDIRKILLLQYTRYASVRHGPNQAIAKLNSWLEQWPTFNCERDTEPALLARPLFQLRLGRRRERTSRALTCSHPPPARIVDARRLHTKKLSPPWAMQCVDQPLSPHDTKTSTCRPIMQQQSEACMLYVCVSARVVVRRVNNL